MGPPDAAKHEVWRLFVAIELPDEIKQHALEIRQRLARSDWRVRWVRAELLHLSLRFYGNLRVDSVVELVEGLNRAMADEHVFRLTTSGAGIFPNPRRPRVIWLGVDDRSDTLQRIAASIERESRANGIEPETRPFQPHITLGRMRLEDTSTISEVEQHFTDIARLTPISFQVDHVSLIRSDLRHEGPIYTVVERFTLGTEQ